MKLEFLNTRFIYGPKVQIGNVVQYYNSNFAGNPDIDKWHSNLRRANIVIPDNNMALDMKNIGCNVKWTELPKDTSRMSQDQIEQFVPRPFVSIMLKYGKDPNKWPKVFLAREGMPALLLDPDNVGDVDTIKVDYINVLCNTYEKDPGHITLYVDTMLVVPKTRTDPIWLQSFMQPQVTSDEPGFDLPFDV